MNVIKLYRYYDIPITWVTSCGNVVNIILSPPALICKTGVGHEHSFSNFKSILYLVIGEVNIVLTVEIAYYPTPL